jgi:hypothetical protein
LILLLHFTSYLFNLCMYTSTPYMPHTSNLSRHTLTVISLSIILTFSRITFLPLHIRKYSLSVILVFLLITFLPLYVRTFHQYVDWVNTNDPEAEWNGEEACHMYAHKNGVDLFKGTYYVLPYILHTVPSLPCTEISFLLFCFFA